MTFLIATKNLHKLEEMQRILSPLGISCICERDLEAPLPEVEETGETFAENALLKAESALKVTGLPVIADDSGLCVNALGGRPGVYSSRYAGEQAGSAENIEKLLGEMQEKTDRTAYFCCYIVCLLPDGRRIDFDGRCEGEIMNEPQGQNGFGYDPVFLSEFGSFALITAAQKDSISHRGRALRGLFDKLKTYMEENIHD